MNNKSHQLLGQSPEFLRALHAARMVAGTDVTVLVSGERGSGKEMFAREIHGVSRRQRRPFVVVPSAGITASVLETALLGQGDEKHELVGMVAAAEGGMLFLDEVGNLSADAQGVLWRFLEWREAGRQTLLDLRLVVSSSQRIQGLVERGLFREDLYYRLYVVPLELPPLRERVDDIILLAKQFTAELARTHGRKAPRYSVGVRNLLKSYHWPGNIRELHNFCERSVILLAGTMVHPENLPLEIQRGLQQQQSGTNFVLPEQGIDLQLLEIDVIRQALGMSGGNRSRAARLLGISRDTLLYRIQKHAITS